MFSDPQTITIDGVAKTLPAINRGETSSTYRKADGELTFTVSHQKTGKGRYRHLIRVDRSVIGTDPFTSNNMEFQDAVYLVIDRPSIGIDNVDVRKLALGLVGFATSGNLDKVIALES